MIYDSSTINSQPSTHFAAFDGNGNVSALVKASAGTSSAVYEYSPFGEVLRATGPIAKANPLRFSTKFLDDESDLLYYGYRYYSAGSGRWNSRDPVGETAGNNLYLAMTNSPVLSLDPLGLCCECALSVSMANISKVTHDLTPGSVAKMYGHQFDIVIQLAYIDCAADGKADLGWWEKSDHPPAIYKGFNVPPNEWKDMAYLAGGLKTWNARDTSCRKSMSVLRTVTINDEPLYGTASGPSRYIEFDIRVSNPPCCTTSCGTWDLRSPDPVRARQDLAATGPDTITKQELN
jgi:RHS repeat-associated protein